MMKLALAYGNFEEPKTDNNLLYYYCSMDTFSAIIKSKKVWLRDLRAMNDPSELFLSRIDISPEIIEQYKRQPFDIEFKGEKNERALERLLSPLQLSYSSGFNSTNNNYFFAVCMSDEENSLSQWRMYADNGSGVCLGFEKEKVQNFIKSNTNYSLQEIEYKNDVTEIIKTVGCTILEKIKKDYNSRKEIDLEQFMNELQVQFMSEWTKYKTNDYKGERETRLVYKKHTDQFCMNVNALDISEEFLSNIDWSLRNGGFDLHTAINIGDLGLRTITLGPRNEMTKGTLNIVLAKENIDIPNDKLYRSKIPYRG